MKTLADLKRDARSGLYEAMMTLRCGSTDIPERVAGWRKMVGSNTVAIIFQTNDGKKSELRVDSAKLVEYDGNTLTIFYAGERELNAKEQAVMDGWRKIAETDEYKRNADYDALTDGTSTYWQERNYFADAGYEYLLGNKEQRGKRYNLSTQKVIDKSIRGAVCMKYEVRKCGVA